MHALEERRSVVEEDPIQRLLIAPQALQVLLREDMNGVSYDSWTPEASIRKHSPKSLEKERAIDQNRSTHTTPHPIKTEPPGSAIDG
jgi:hypothetical protein